jgi:hypothetical protein
MSSSPPVGAKDSKARDGLTTGPDPLPIVKSSLPYGGPLFMLLIYFGGGGVGDAQKPSMHWAVLSQQSDDWTHLSPN